VYEAERQSPRVECRVAPPPFAGHRCEVDLEDQRKEFRVAGPDELLGLDEVVEAHESVPVPVEEVEEGPLGPVRGLHHPAQHREVGRPQLTAVEGAQQLEGALHPRLDLGILEAYISHSAGEAHFPGFVRFAAFAAFATRRAYQWANRVLRT